MKPGILPSLSIAAVILACGDAHAQYRGGFNFDVLRYSPERIAGVPLPELGFFIANTALDDRRSRYGLQLGYRLNPQLSLVTHAALFDKRESALLPARRYGLDLVATVPLAERFSLYASAGAVRLSGDSTLGGTYYGGLAGSSNDRAMNAARLGLGLQYQFSNSLGLRFDVERYRALGTIQPGAFDADNVSLGVSLRF